MTERTTSSSATISPSMLCRIPFYAAPSTEFPLSKALPGAQRKRSHNFAHAAGSALRSGSFRTRGSNHFSLNLWKEHKRCSGDQGRHQGSEKKVQRRNPGFSESRREDGLTRWVW